EPMPRPPPARKPQADPPTRPRSHHRLYRSRSSRASQPPDDESHTPNPGSTASLARGAPDPETGVAVRPAREKAHLVPFAPRVPSLDPPALVASLSTRGWRNVPSRSRPRRPAARRTPADIASGQSAVPPPAEFGRTAPPSSS